MDIQLLSYFDLPCLIWSFPKLPQSLPLACLSRCSWHLRWSFMTQNSKVQLLQFGERVGKKVHHLQIFKFQNYPKSLLQVCSWSRVFHWPGLTAFCYVSLPIASLGHLHVACLAPHGIPKIQRTWPHWNSADTATCAQVRPLWPYQ